MFSNRFKCALVGLALASPMPALADWIGPFPVKYIESRGGSLFFMLDWTGGTNYTPTITGCNNTTIYFPASTLQTKDIDRALSIGLTAQATGTKVRFYITGCTNYLTADSIAIDPGW